jgi:uncharacterized caspase-like protein
MVMRSLLLGGLLAVAGAVAAQQPDARTALVIGNAAYAAPDVPLRNPANDAREIAAALERLRFSVQLLQDADHASMRRAIREYEDKLRNTEGVGFFYFAGHGLQVEGRNYLVPVGAALTKESDARERAVDATELIQRLRSAGNRLNIVVLDACRDNPLVKPSVAFRSSRSPFGLAPVRPAKGMLIAFAAEPGRVASDGTSGRGLYARHLTRYMLTPGLSLEQVFKRVRDAVEQESSGSQIPVDFSTLTGDDFYLISQP